MSAEDDLGKMISAIVSDQTADRATVLAGGITLGTMLAGVYRGLTQGGMPSGAALEVVKAVAVAGIQKK